MRFKTLNSPGTQAGRACLVMGYSGKVLLTFLKSLVEVQWLYYQRTVEMGDSLMPF